MEPSELNWSGIPTTQESLKEHAVVATRSFILWTAGAPTRVELRLYAPYYNGRQFFCGYELLGLPEPVCRNAAGADSLQALLLALTGVQRTLDQVKDKVEWCGRRGDIGLPHRMFFWTPNNQKLRGEVDKVVDEYEAEMAERVRAPEE